MEEKWEEIAGRRGWIILSEDTEVTKEMWDIEPISNPLKE